MTRAEYCEDRSGTGILSTSDADGNAEYGHPLIGDARKGVKDC